jgi:hypothetical protein
MSEGTNTLNYKHPVRSHPKRSSRSHSELHTQSISRYSAYNLLLERHHLQKSGAVKIVVLAGAFAKLQVEYSIVRTELKIKPGKLAFLKC